MGTGGAGTESTFRVFRALEEMGPAGANPILFPTTVSNAPAGMLGIELGMAGPNTTFAQRGNAAEAALICAARWIRQGRCVRMTIRSASVRAARRG
jgi:3-oxoacyl-(acyl-carrier-protein) synthase